MITWEEFKTNKKYWVYAGIIIILVLMVCGDRGEYRNERKSETPNVIAISGHGEVNAVPDIASVSFTIRKEAKTVKEAQSGVTEVEKKALELLRANKIADKDIKTQNASFNPKYEYQYGTNCRMGYCPGKNVAVGYEAYENITVKIRNTDDAGKIIEGLGAIGVTELNGPNFTIDDEDGLKAQARKMAIDDAKAKAKALAKDLDIRLGKMTSFSEGGNYPMPMYESAKMMTNSIAGAGAPAELPKGENTISSDVTLTYEIR